MVECQQNKAMLVLTNLKKKKLKKKDIFGICKLKNTVWKFGIKSNLRWFRENVRNDDLNIVLKLNNSIIGYTLLRKRVYFEKNKKKNFFYLDTIIVAKKFRKEKFGKLLIQFNNFLISRSDFLGFLLCKNKDIKFYKKFGWKTLNTNSYSIQNKNNKNLYGMSFNLGNGNFKKFIL